MWRCKDDLEDIDQVFLALATGSLNTGFDAMDIVVVPEDELAAGGLTTEGTEGDTAVPALRSRHVDLVALDLDKLGTFARILDSRIRNYQVRRRTESRIKSLVREAIGEGHVQQDVLSPELRKKL